MRQRIISAKPGPDKRLRARIGVSADAMRLPVLGQTSTVSDEFRLGVRGRRKLR